ncbi:hypothetical protein RH858_16125 [Halalkaliarchaeum sp. AArc-GB]|uniref:hypothetical protein n=1 Tax=Halalkaliarchaeum sp. AArc-GB TaxID=3074078 RepID=UPI00285D20CE|nr:hypothetical protein [Halalkaliarchaeum sp. AArc-GB]MDR5674653.1 hypothetical protein [Halalkaliarchaeum sp. AArc-GB]
MLPLQGGSVLLLSVLALIAYAIVSGLVAQDAKKQGVDHPGVWGAAVFVAMMLGTWFVDRQILAAIVAGGLVIIFYVLVARN